MGRVTNENQHYANTRAAQNVHIAWVCVNTMGALCCASILADARTRQAEEEVCANAMGAKWHAGTRQGVRTWQTEEEVCARGMVVRSCVHIMGAPDIHREEVACAWCMGV